MLDATMTDLPASTRVCTPQRSSTPRAATQLGLPQRNATLDDQRNQRLPAHARLRGQPHQAATPSGSNPRWHVVATYAQAERRAVANLQRQGYHCWLPLIIVPRRDRVLRTLVHRVEVPLFPAYAFCQFDPQRDPWSPIRNTPGVYSLLMTAGKPAPVQHGAVEALQAAQAAREALGAEMPQWAPGTPCTLAAGPFAHHPAVVLSVTGRRARVSVLMFGALRGVTCAITALLPRD
jgi:transcriptional antiterminator RfaH